MKSNFTPLFRQAVLTAGLVSFLLAPAHGRIGLPVTLSLSSGDALRRGEPATVYVTMSPAADVPFVNFEVLPSTDWQILEGTTQWAGALQAGQTREFQFKALPLTDSPEPLKARLAAPDAPERRASLDPNRMGGRFPELGEQALDKTQTRSAEEAIQPQFEPGVVLPEPMAATEPRVPGQAPKGRPAATNKAKGERGASVSAVASGRFSYLDDHSPAVRHGVRNATVELKNSNPGNPFGDDLCGTGVTDGDGNFSVSGTCGDLFDNPDLYVRIVLNNSVVEVKPDNVFAGSYAFRSAVRQNSAGGAINFGDINITTNRTAFQAHNLVMRAQQFMATQGESLSKVTVLHPAADTFYSPAFIPGTTPSISVEAGLPFSEEGDIFHEYGHHILTTLAESPSPDYNNGICDTPTPGHCLGSPEKGVISWTEGWPDFLGNFLHDKFAAADSYGPTRKYNFKNNPDPDTFAFPGLEDKTEAVIASILLDLVDSDTEPNGQPGRRDNIALGFGPMWNVIKNFDPSADLFHNHPTSIHEFWSGLREFRLNDINRVSEVYAKHHIFKPQPDLEVTSVQAPPTILDRGVLFSLNNTVKNTGDELANNAFFVRFVFRATLGGANFIAGQRQVGAGLNAGASSSATTNLSVPTTATPGFYQLQVCADPGQAVPESDETNNCRVAANNIQVR